jgi:hypothetical protein
MSEILWFNYKNSKICVREVMEEFLMTSKKKVLKKKILRNFIVFLGCQGKAEICWTGHGEDDSVTRVLCQEKRQLMLATNQQVTNQQETTQPSTLSCKMPTHVSDKSTSDESTRDNSTNYSGMKNANSC